MTTFRLKMVDAHGVGHDFFYNNMRSTLVEARTSRALFPARADSGPNTAADMSFRKSSVVRTLKIQLGLSCNYSCEYCSQRFVPHAEPTGPYSVDQFISRLSWNASLADDATIEFWGGEPLVYWKTLVPLVDALQMRYPALTLKMITNGSLLDPDKVSWLVSRGFHIGISHDGPGQSTRGPDPLANPVTREAILALYRRLRPLNRISFNAMLHRNNTSRAAIQQFFVELTGDKDVPIGEGMFVDAYDEGGRDMSFLDPHDHVDYRRRAYNELWSGRALNFTSVTEKILDFGTSLRERRRAITLGQKCGSDRADTLTVTLNGDVLTCQNVSAVATAPNGKPHLAGTLDELAQVEIESSRHWITREKCSSCPVLQLCKGSCMFLEGDLWDVTCETAYSDNVAFFAMALYELTGCTLKRIEPLEDDLPEHRQNVFGPLTTPRTTTRKIIRIATA
jgi:uncharacterized protein